MVRCGMLGHRVRFSAEGAELRWHCERDCGFEGTKRYADAATAAKYAAAFDREDRSSLGHRAPLIGLAPLRGWYFLRSRRSRSARPHG